MATLSTFEQAYNEARRRFASVADWIEATFAEPTLRDLLEELSAGEQEALAAQRSLIDLRNAGLATDADFEAYNKMRAALFGAQTKVYAAVVAVVRPLDSSVVPRIPFPRLMPEVPRRAGMGELGTTTTIAIVILSLLASLAIAYILGEVLINVTQELSGVFIAQARARQFRDLAETRLAAYRECIANGGTAESCGVVATETVPTPRESGTETPEPGALDPTPWVLLGVGGTVLALAAGAAFWFYRKSTRLLPSGTAGVGSVPVRNVAALPAHAPDLDGSKSRYNLEISGPAGIGRARRKRGRK